MTPGRAPSTPASNDPLLRRHLPVLELGRVLAEVPDVPVCVLGIPVERVLDHLAVPRDGVADDPRVTPLAICFVSVVTVTTTFSSSPFLVGLAICPARAGHHRPVAVVDLGREPAGSRSTGSLPCGRSAPGMPWSSAPQPVPIRSAAETLTSATNRLPIAHLPSRRVPATGKRFAGESAWALTNGALPTARVRTSSAPEPLVDRRRLFCDMRSAYVDASPPRANTSRHESANVNEPESSFTMPMSCSTAERKDDSPDAGPVDRTRTHRARLRARVERGRPQGVDVELLAGGTHQVELSVGQ